MRANALLLVAILALSSAAARGSSPPKSETTVRSLVQEAEQARASGYLDKAFALSKEALEIAPEDPEALVLAGSLAAGAERFDEAERILSLACRLRPDDPKILVSLGDARIARGVRCKRRWDLGCRDEAVAAALDAYGEARRLSRDSIGAKRGVSIALLVAGRLRASIEAHEAWIAAAPNDPESGISLATALAEAEFWNDVASLPDRFAEHDPETAGIVGLRVLGLLYEHGHREMGDSLLRRLLRIGAPRAQKIALKALHDAIRGHHDQALFGLRRYLSDKPPPEEAEVVYNEILDRVPRKVGRRVDSSEETDSSDPFWDWQPPKLVRQRDPTYPFLLEQSAVEGSAVIETQVRADGTIGRVKLVTATHPEFAVAALEAVKQWRYEPSTYHGRPVSSYRLVHVDFRIPGR